MYLKLCRDAIKRQQSVIHVFSVAKKELNFLCKVETAAKGQLWEWGTTATNPDTIY